MIKTGFIRKIDDFGRYAIHKDVRRKLDICEGTALELFIGEDNSLILKEYRPIDPVTAAVEELKKRIENTDEFSGRGEIMRALHEIEARIEEGRNG